VHGYDNSTGSFGLSIEDGGGNPTFDNCRLAGGPIPLNKEVPLELSESARYDPNVLPCGFNNADFDNIIQQGAWFYTIGDGGDLTFSVCDSPEGTEIFVYEANLACIDPSCVRVVAYSGCSITWKSEALQEYFLFVSGSKYDACTLPGFSCLTIVLFAGARCG